VRIGSPAMTTRGFKDAEAKLVANLVADALEAAGNDAAIAKVGEAVNTLCAKFPVYGPAMRATFGMK
jgi:glycine hydroxymethyltransferase